MDPVRLAPFSSVILSTPPFSLCLPYVSMSWTDLGNQTATIVLLSVWIECVERHIAIIVTIRCFLSSCLFHSECSSQLSLSIWLSLFRGSYCMSCLALVDCVTLCCGLTKRVETWAKCGRSGYSGIWHVAMLLPLQKSFWLISCTVHQGFKEETQGDLRV